MSLHATIKVGNSLRSLKELITTHVVQNQYLVHCSCLHVLVIISINFDTPPQIKTLKPVFGDSLLSNETKYYDLIWKLFASTAK